MKPVRTTKYFDKVYLKRIAHNSKLRRSYIKWVTLFSIGERGYPLKDHELTGKLAGKRAFSITADVRVVYEEQDEFIIFLDVGSHNQVY